MKNLAFLPAQFTLIFLTIFLLSFQAEAQYNFHKAFNLAYEVHTPAQSLTTAGDYISTGFYFPTTINGFPSSTARLEVLKIDNSFNLQWAKHYLLNSEISSNIYNVDLRAYDVKQISGGNYILCGEIVESGPGGVSSKHAFIMKINPGGSVLWFFKYFPNGNLNSIVETDAGGFLATGYIELSGGGEVNRLLRINPLGNVVWLKTVTSTSGNGPHSAFREVVRHSNNKYVAVGNIATQMDASFCVQESEVLLTIIDENPFPTTLTNIPIGRLTDPLSNQFAEFGNTVTVNGQGNIIIAGHVRRSHVSDCDPNGPQDLLLLKVTPTGSILLAQEINLQGQDIGRDVAINSLFSEICVAGISDNDAFLYTSDMSGTFQKLEFFNHAGFATTATSLVENGSSRYTFVGNTEVLGSGYQDHYLVEQDPTTVLDCHDWDETRTPPSVVLNVFNGDAINLMVTEFQVAVQAFDIPVLDTILCSSSCDPPIAINDTLSVCQDGTLSANIYTNDTYTSPASGTILSGPTHGTASVNSSSGLLTYTPFIAYIGSDLIEYEICDPCGCDTAFVLIMVNPKPDANFSYTISGLTVSFTDLSTNGPTSWLWDFGDGTGSTLQNPSHTYSSGGGYAVCLTATNSCGSDIFCDQFFLNCPAPTAFDDFLSLCENESGGVNLFSNDMFTTITSAAITGGPSFGTASLNPVTGDFTYSPNSGYSGIEFVTYEICDACGCSAAQVHITVNPFPDANFSYAASNLTVDFTDLSTNGPMSWLWDFGDGTSSTLQHPTHTYAIPGGYAVCLTATNACGSDTFCDQFIVDCPVPMAINDTISGCLGYSTGLYSNDINSSGVVGQIITPPLGGTYSFNGFSGIFMYSPDSASVGTFTAEYEICNECACDTALIIIEVLRPPVADFTYSFSGLTVNFTDLSTNDPFSWLWSFGDGTPISGAQNAVHTYASAGTYSVILSVMNNCGGDSHTEEISFLCSNTVPAADNFLICSPNGGSINPLLNDTFTPPPVFNIINGPSNGSFSNQGPGGDIYYTPDPGFTGTDMAMYELCDNCGQCFSETITLSVNLVPTAQYTHTTNGPAADFIDQSVNAESWSWDFGDGNSSVDENPSHTYDANGIYNVCVTVTNPCGTDIICGDVTIDVPCSPPFAVQDYETVCADSTVNFNVLINDIYTPPPFINIVIPPANGTITFLDPFSGDITYTADPTYPGYDSFMYGLTDFCGSDTAWVYLGCNQGNSVVFDGISHTGLGSGIPGIGEVPPVLMVSNIGSSGLDGVVMDWPGDAPGGISTKMDFVESFSGTPNGSYIEFQESGGGCAGSIPLWFRVTSTATGYNFSSSRMGPHFLRLYNNGILVLNTQISDSFFDVIGPLLNGDGELSVLIGNVVRIQARLAQNVQIGPNMYTADEIILFPIDDFNESVIVSGMTVVGSGVNNLNFEEIQLHFPKAGFHSRGQALYDNVDCQGAMRLNNIGSSGLEGVIIDVKKDLTSSWKQAACEANIWMDLGYPVLTSGQRVSFTPILEVNSSDLGGQELGFTVNGSGTIDMDVIQGDPSLNFSKIEFFNAGTSVGTVLNPAYGLIASGLSDFPSEFKYSWKVEEGEGLVSFNFESLQNFQIPGQTYIGDKVQLHIGPGLGNSALLSAIEIHGLNLTSTDHLSTLYLQVVRECQYIQLQPKVYPEGFFIDENQGLRDDLNDLGSLPAVHPFGQGFWNYSGLEIVPDYQQLRGHPQYGNVVDWIMVFLLDDADPGVILDQQAGLLWQTGDITGLDGTALRFSQPEGSYYVAIMPRNHTGVVTAGALFLDKSTPHFIDFTNPSTPTWGGSMAQKSIGTVKVLYSGDGNGDGFINSIDLNTLWRPQNGVSTGYSLADFNGDNVVNAVDLNLYFRPNFGLQAQYPFNWP